MSFTNTSYHNNDVATTLPKPLYGAGSSTLAKIERLNVTLSEKTQTIEKSKELKSVELLDGFITLQRTAGNSSPGPFVQPREGVTDDRSCDGSDGADSIYDSHVTVTSMSIPSSATHDISMEMYHINLKLFGKSLQDAAARAFPCATQPRYQRVHVLMLSWAKDNLGMSDELDALENIFNNQYSYGTEKWQIPSTSSQADLAVKTAAFVKEHQDPESLLVIYYARHGTIGENRRSIWSCGRGSWYSSIDWSSVQPLLEESSSDVLLLLDCCSVSSGTVANGVTSPPNGSRYHHIETMEDDKGRPKARIKNGNFRSAAAREKWVGEQKVAKRPTEFSGKPQEVVSFFEQSQPKDDVSNTVPTSTDSGVIETIAASGGYQKFPAGLDRWNFTTRLIKALRSWTGKPFTAAMLHAEIVRQMRNQKSEQSTTHLPGGKSCRTPIRTFKARGPEFPSIELSVVPPRLDNEEILQSSVTNWLDSEIPFTKERVPGLEELPQDPTKFVSGDYSQIPRVLLSVRLKEEISSKALADFLPEFQSLEKYSRVEGIYQTFESTLMLLSLPITIWDLLPEQPAWQFLGIVTSKNLQTGSILPHPEVVQESSLPNEVIFEAESKSELDDNVDSAVHIRSSVDDMPMDEEGLNHFLKTSSITLKQNLINLLMREYYQISGSADCQAIRTCAGSTSASRSSRANVPGTPSRSTASGTSGRKRSSGDDREDGESDDKNPPKRRPKVGTTSSDPASRNRRYACPYHKHNRTKFRPETDNRYKPCPGSFMDIAKLKEHLYRVHFAQWKCPRCKAGFPNALQFQYHCEAFEACPPQLDRDPETGYSLLVYNLLKVRKKSAAEEEGSERWKEMYRHLFPNEPVPSPFLDDDDGGDGSMELPPDAAPNLVGPHIVRSQFEDQVDGELDGPLQLMARNLLRNAPNIIRESQETWLQSSRRFETPHSAIEDNSMDMLHPQFQPALKEEPWLNTRNPIDFSVLENISQVPHLFSSGNKYQEPESVRGTASYTKEQMQDSLFSSDLNPGVTSKSNPPVSNPGH